MNKKKRIFATILVISLFINSYSPICASAETSRTQSENAEPAIVEGELLVTFKEHVTEKKAENAVEKVDGEIMGSIDENMDLALVEIDENTNAAKAMEKLEKLPQVEAVQPNYIYYTYEDPVGSSDMDAYVNSSGSDASEYDIWHLDYMQVQKAWDLIDTVKPKTERTAEDKIKVAILDTGISKHEDLTDNIDWKNSVTVIESEQVPYTEDGDAADEDTAQETIPSDDIPEGTPDSSGTTDDPEPPEQPEEEPVYSSYDQPAAQHGTNVAGLIASTAFNGFGTAGVAAGNNNDLIELMGIKVFHTGAYTNGQASATTMDIIKGLQYACDKNAKVINMCLGHEPGTMDSMGSFHDDVLLESEVNRAVTEHDVVIICSAGNKKDTRTWYPSDFDNVVSVINTQKYDNAWTNDVKSASSSYGSKKDVSAPGAYVYTTNGTKSYKNAAGTSYSASCATGVAALVRYVAPELTAEQVKEILYSTATDLYTDGYDIYTGYGNLNAYKAVTQAAGLPLPESSEKMQAATVTAKSMGTQTIGLSWKTVKNANGYYIYRSTDKDGTYTRIAHITNGMTNSYTDSGRVFNKKYYYAIETLGTSKNTKEKIKSDMSKTVSCKAVPAAPNFSISRLNSYSLKLSWERVSGANGYRIYRSTTKNGTYKSVKTIAKGKTVTWSDKNCTPGKKYYYKIRAYKNKNGRKVWGTISNCKYKKAQPVKVKNFKIIKRSNKAVLSWKKDTTVSGYKIYRSINSNGKWRQVNNIKTNTKVTYTTKKLNKGKKYSYKVRPYIIVNGKTIYGAYSSIKSAEF